MAIQTSIAVGKLLVRSLDTGLFVQIFKPVLPVTAQNDSQVIATQRHSGRLVTAHLRVPANLGAGATAKLQKRDVGTGTAVDITAATTAATAGVVSSAGLLPIDFNDGDTIELLVSGAATTVAATIEIDLQMQRA